MWTTLKKTSRQESLGLEKMEGNNIEKRVFIIEEYFKNNKNWANTVQKFHTKYDRNNILNIWSNV